MTGLIIFFHAVICILLITIILIQPGKSGGLTEGLASAESIFGAKTNVFIIKTTTILAVFFLVTCLGLAVLSSQKGKSLMSQQSLPPVSAPQPAQEAPKSPSVNESVVEPESVPQLSGEAASELAPEPETAPEAEVPAATQP